MRVDRFVVVYQEGEYGRDRDGYNDVFYEYPKVVRLTSEDEQVEWIASHEKMDTSSGTYAFDLLYYGEELSQTSF